MGVLTYKLSAYEGPIDLLYQLIKEHEIDICDIPIAQLTDQYLDFIDRAEARDMDSMSEFAYMAATLLEIKSAMLLPAPVVEKKEDPRKELVDKLLEFKRMKQTAEFLMQIQSKDNISFYKRPDANLIASFRPKETVEKALDGVSVTMLYQIFKEVVNKKEFRIDRIRSSFKSVTKDIFTVEEKMDYLLSLLGLADNVSLQTVLSECVYKIEMVVTFLAVLELIKADGIEAHQTRAFSDIVIKRGSL